LTSIIKGLAAIFALVMVNQSGAHLATGHKTAHQPTPAAVSQQPESAPDTSKTDAYSWLRGYDNRPVFPPPEPTPDPAAQPAPADIPAPVAANPAPPRPPAPPPVVVGSAQQSYINGDRSGAGLGPLTWNSCLAGIAYQNAVRMANQGFISHAGGPNQDLGCGLGSRAGENVGYWSGGINDAQLNTMFMNSPDHRANIMGPYHFVGTAWVVARNGSGYIAVEFG
jgi:uncharacterized protein YkwD